MSACKKPQKTAFYIEVYLRDEINSVKASMTTAVNAERFALAAFRNAAQTAEDLETVEINE